MGTVEKVPSARPMLMRGNDGHLLWHDVWAEKRDREDAHLPSWVAVRRPVGGGREEAALGTAGSPLRWNDPDLALEDIRHGVAQWGWGTD